MCGRYGFVPKENFYTRFDIDNHLATLEARYNAAPGQLMVVVTRNSPNKAVFMKWGLIPHWAQDPKIGYQMINARAETVRQKPAFCNSLVSKRCLVPASGFFEWKKAEDGKIPYYIHLQNTDIFSFAGLFDTWTDGEGKEISSYTIITTTPNDFMVSIHDRMPVILQEVDEKIWLDPDIKDIENLMGLLKPYPSSEMIAYPVSRDVNKPENDDENILKPFEYKESQRTLF